MRALYSACRLCPRACGVDRTSGETGFCGAGAVPRAARAALHFYEEPCLSGTEGAGAVFFTHCSLRCVFCQNGALSRGEVGWEADAERLAEIYLDLQEQGANNIDLVTACHYAPDVAQSIALAKQRGLAVPVVYNSSGYESVDTLRLFEGLVDIYLPDMKYCRDEYAARYSGCPGYFAAAKAAVSEMVRQTGRQSFDDRGRMRRGVIVRHLALPHLLFDSKKIVDYLFSTYGNDITLSLMSQYTPCGDLTAYPELAAPLRRESYAALVDYAASLGLTNAYVQEGGAVGESFIPAFDGQGVCSSTKKD